MTLRIAFCASNAPIAQSAKAALSARYGDHAEQGADVIVALGGDGFMLQTLHRYADTVVHPVGTGGIEEIGRAGLLDARKRAVVDHTRGRTDTVGR